MKKRSHEQETGASGAQINRFFETARALGCDEDKERFEEALGRIAARKPKKPPRSAKAKKAPRG
jgi:hypothetical protein